MKKNKFFSNQRVWLFLILLLSNQQSRLKIRWSNTKALFLLIFGMVLFATQIQAQYCIPTYVTGCTDGDTLNSFIITGDGSSVISDLDTGCGTGGYSDRTTLFTPVNLTQGNSYQVQMNTNYNVPGNERASIWIDFNDNGTFEASEKLLTDFPMAAALTPAFATASIAIPGTAPVGIHRMRVRVVYTGSGFDACSSQNYGEAQDYLVNITSLTPTTSGCTWTVSVYNPTGTGTGVTWTLKNNSGTTLLSGGPYTGNGYNDTKTVTAEGPLTFNITSGGNYPYYKINNGTIDVAKGILGQSQNKTITDLQCGGTPPVAEPCTISYDGNNLVNGISAQTQIVANDFEVTTPMNVNQVTLRMFTVPTNPILTFYTNNAGKPGSVIQSFTNPTQVSQTVVGSLNTLTAYDVVYDLPADVPFTNGIYWLGVKTSNTSFWTTADQPVNNQEYTSSNGGTSWTIANSNYYDGPMILKDKNCSTTTSSCNWTVHIYNPEYYGDGVTWTLKNGSGTTLLSGGPYGASGFDDTQTVTAEGPLTFAMNDSIGDNVAFYNINNGTMDVATGMMAYGNPINISGLNCGGTPPVPQTCGVTFAGENLQDGMGDTQSYQVANDFQVASGVLNANQVTVRMLGTPSNAGLTFYNDGSGEPGSVKQSFTNVAPASQTYISTVYGLDVYDITYNLPSNVLFSNGTYWLGITTASTGYWATADQLTGSTELVLDGGIWYTNGYGYDGAFKVSGDCTPLPSCSGTPTAGTVSAPANICANAPFTLSVTGTTLADGITFQWYSGSTPITGATSSSYTVTNQTATTSYYCVVTCSNTGLSAQTNTVTVTQNPANQCYCIPAYSTGCDEGDDLNSFVITGDGASVISDLNTGCSTGGYSDKTALFAPVNLTQGNSYQVQMNTEYDDDVEYGSIWIDFNDDGVFDTSEKVLNEYPLSLTPAFATASITVPTSAPAGVHRMRVRVVYFGSGFDACDLESFGEAHDYLVNVTEPVIDPNACGWTVTVSGNRGDEVSWTLKNSGGTTLLSGGPYTTLGFNDVKTVSASGPLTFYIESIGNFNDNTPSYSVSNANGVIAQGTLTGGTEATQDGLDCDDLAVSDFGKEGFAYYPNPVKDVLNIQTKTAVVNVEVFNLVGQRVMKNTKISNGQINVKSLVTGTYVFRISLKDGQVETFKVIKE